MNEQNNNKKKASSVERVYDRPLLDDAVEMVRLRNNFYRDNYHRIVFAVLFLLVIIAVLIGIIVYQVLDKPTPKYFATTSDGRLIPLIPLNVPLVTQPVLLQWAQEAAVSSYTYDFVDYRKSLQRAGEFYTPTGWNQFMAALKESRNLETVQQKKLVVTAVATDAPVILQEGILNGRYAWRVQMPMVVKYQSASEQRSTPVIVTMLIVRVSTLERPRGIAIDQIVVASDTRQATKPGA